MPLSYCEETQQETANLGEPRTYTRYFRASTGDNDGPETILRGRPDIARHQPHPQDREARVTDPKFERVGPGLWTVTVEYSTATEKKENPLSRATDWDLSGFSARTIGLLRDAKNRPILNTAGDLFDDPPPSVERHFPLLRGTRNIPTAFPPWLLDYTDCLNSDAVRIRGLTFPALTLRAKVGVGPEDSENDVAFSVLTMEFEVNPFGWTHYQPNRGYFELYYDRGQDPAKAPKPAGKRRILIDGEPASEPQWLDKYGRAITDPAANTDKLLFLPFDLHPARPFSRLPL